MDSLQATAVVYSAVRAGSGGGCAGLTCKLKMYCFFPPLGKENRPTY